jgi:hypothetical protein
MLNRLFAVEVFLRAFCGVLECGLDRLGLTYGRFYLGGNQIAELGQVSVVRINPAVVRRVVDRFDQRIRDVR